MLARAGSDAVRDGVPLRLGDVGEARHGGRPQKEESTRNVGRALGTGHDGVLLELHSFCLVWVGVSICQVTAPAALDLPVVARDGVAHNGDARHLD